MEFSMNRFSTTFSSIWKGFTDLAAGKVRFIPPEDRWMIRGPLLPGNITPPEPEKLEIEGVHLELYVPLGLTAEQYRGALDRLVAFNLAEPERVDFHLSKAFGKTDEATRRYRIAAYAFVDMMDEQSRAGHSPYYAARKAFDVLNGTGRMAGTVAAFD
ncbi:MAG: hypothetical protein AB7E85_03995 [Pseudobdellovibrionaceae bacterium]